MLKMFAWFSVSFKIKPKLLSMTFKFSVIQTPALRLISPLPTSYHPSPLILCQLSPTAFLETQKMNLSILDLGRTIDHIFR